MTANQYYTLSDQTKELLDGLSGDVTIYQLTEDGSSDGMVENLLDQYAGHSGHVKVVKKDLSKSTVVTVPIIAPANVKLIPSEIEVRINVEPLVRKETYIRVDVDNLPAGEGLLLFPNSVPVSFYVPMSRFNDDSFPIRVYVDYQDTYKTPGSRIPLYLVDSSGSIINPALSTDSVEYTLVKKK